MQTSGRNLLNGRVIDNFSIVTAFLWIIPLLFYFIFLPISGSSASHSKNPELFLPWLITHSQVRIGLWVTSAVLFLISMLGAPIGIWYRMRDRSPITGVVAFILGILGFLLLFIVCAVLGSGELPLAVAYNQVPEAKSAIIVLYDWQRLVTAILFDFIGMGLIGTWVLIITLEHLYNRTAPVYFIGIGIFTTLTCFCFAIGYIAQIKWLGEFGFGALSFIGIPCFIGASGFLHRKKSIP